jgi:hypothetical protein
MNVDRQNLSVRYDELVRRAELFTRIEQLVVGRAADQRGSNVRPLTRHRAVLDLPRIVVMDRRVLCDGRTLDLARRPLTLKLFELFVSAEKEVIQRDALVAALYGVEADGHSDRYAQSLLGNAIKLVSRARAVAASVLTGPEHAGLEWFPYDHERMCWSLYRLHHRYWIDRLS